MDLGDFVARSGTVTEVRWRRTCVRSFFLQEHWHGTFTEVIIIQLQFCQQGPIRYNSRVSSYNPRAVRRDAGRQLPDTGTVQRLSPTVPALLMVRDARPKFASLHRTMETND